MKHKSINTHLVFASVAAIFTLSALPAPSLAGTEIDQANDDVHACLDAGDCDNELYLTAPVSPNFQVSGTQTAEVSQVFRFSLDKLPPELTMFLNLSEGQCITIGTASEAPEGKPGDCVFYQVAAGEVCTLTDVNGDARTITANNGGFASTYTRLRPDFSDVRYWNYLYLEATVYCSDY